MITVAEALAILERACPPMPEETVPLREAVGRVPTREVRSDVDWPPFDTSAMDGYAVLRADVPAPGAVLVERPGVVGAGAAPVAELKNGEAVRVMTGAPLPPGAEAVLPVEQVRREAGIIVAGVVPKQGEHIRRRGESVTAGSPVLSARQRLRPADVALAALAGAEPLSVFERPRVSIAVTGNELVPASQVPRPGQLRDSNGPMLAALVASRGIAATLAPAVADDDGEVRRLFREAGRGEDVLLTSGGVSAGDFDLLPERAARAGFEILFHGVAVRPGRPIVLGKKGRTLWLGLPGNPVSTAVCFHLFVRTALDALEGVVPAGPAFVAARLTHDLAARGPRETYRDATLEEEGGEIRARALETRGSHDLAAHARANALLRIPAGTEHLPAGSLVECIRL